jgi:DNA-binding NarL/FixJ family response regulator
MDQALPAAEDRGHEVDVSDPVRTNAAARSDSVRVLVVDDDPMFREALAELLRAHGLDVIGTAGSGEQAIQAVAVVEPDVVLMDMQMPGLSGSETAAQLSEIAPAVRILMLTVSGADEDVLDAMLAGASGYLVKGTPPEAVVAAIRATAAGAALLSPTIATKLLGRIRAEASVTASWKSSSSSPAESRTPRSRGRST